ncbi:hypothetical protein SAMN04515666_101315 [Bosea lupini]|uniref:Uncharacterized protein n=1 Tax=Bosea lupini TaxID=1036779 RepID=A0A1H7GC93_9HYPH|nr:hypothetical protein [Bosea lupini]SEK35718.1 hypothetical protein SAMN04515666_101315 [Bosea lupini]
MKGRSVQQHYALAAASRGYLYELPKSVIVGNPAGVFRHVHSFGRVTLRDCVKLGWLERKPVTHPRLGVVMSQIVLTAAGQAELGRPLLRAAARRQAGTPAQEARP